MRKPSFHKATWTPTIQASNGGGNGSGAVSLMLYQDGSAGAPATGQTPASGLYANGTGGTGTAYPFHPGWKMPGVDYKVGSDLPANLTAPTGATTFCGGKVTLSGSTFRTGASALTADCTISGYDFSVGPYAILILTPNCAGHTVTISNNYFRAADSNAAGPGVALISESDTNCTLIVENNTFEGQGCDAVNFGIGQEVSNYADTTINEYNQYLNSGRPGCSITARTLAFRSSTATTTSVTLVVQFDQNRIAAARQPDDPQRRHDRHEHDARPVVQHASSNSARLATPRRSGYARPTRPSRTPRRKACRGKSIGRRAGRRRPAS